MARSTATRKRHTSKVGILDPIKFLETKTKLRPSELLDYQLKAMVYLDAVLIGSGEEKANEGLTRVIVMLQIAAVRMRDRSMYDLTAKTIRLWLAALELAQSRGKAPDLSTSATKAVQRCAQLWLIVLEQIDIGTLAAIANRMLAIEAQHGILRPPPIMEAA